MAAENSLGMVQATDGNFYGYAGLVFRMTLSGKISVVYDWCPPSRYNLPGFQFRPHSRGRWEPLRSDE
jgi:hypothetical protein